MVNSKAKLLNIKGIIKPTRGKIFLTLFLLLLIFIISRFVCRSHVDPGFYLDPSPFFDPSPRIRLCQYLYRTSWLVTVVVLYFISSIAVQQYGGKKINAKSKS